MFCATFTSAASALAAREMWTCRPTPVRLRETSAATAGAAVVIPAAMLVGAVGTLTGFAPLGGLLAAGVLLFAGVRLTQRPAPLPRPDRGTWLWGLAIGLVVVATVVLATWAGWHGLMDHAVLPPPAIGPDA